MNVRNAGKYLVRSEPQDLQVARSRGSYVFDTRGRKYVDFLSGDHGIRAAIPRARALLRVHPSWNYKPQAELARQLASLAPGKLQKCFIATGGTEANEIALQVAMAHTGRSKFASIEGHRRLSRCVKLKLPLDRGAVERLDRLLRGRDIAAFVMEPVILNMGVLVPDWTFMQSVRELCTKYGTLLVFDEVATGFGRTGTVFASEHFGIAPDVMTLGKAITGGYAGLGAAITTAKIARAVQGEVDIHSTYGWHPHAVDAAIATLRHFRRHKARLLENVDLEGDYFLERLSMMKFGRSVLIRVQGLAIGVDLGDEAYAAKLVDRCRRAGLLLGSEGKSLVMFPALNISRRVGKEGLDILESCL